MFFRKKKKTTSQHNSVLQDAVKYYQLGELIKAEQIYRQILRENPDHAETCHLLGILLSRKGQYEQSVKMLGNAIKINPDVPVYYNNLGSTHFQYGYYKEALEAFDKALSKNPGNVDALMNMAQICMNQDNISAAGDALEKAMRIEPGNATILTNLGNIYFLQQAFEKAKLMFESVIENEPGNADAYNNLGSVLKEQGNLEKAKEVYKKALTLNPRLSQTYYNLGSIAEAQGEPEEAKGAYLEALKLNPNLVEAYNNLGMIFHQHSMLDDAVKLFEKALEIRPDSAETYNNLGLAYQAVGKSTEAYEAYNKSLELKPDFAEALNNLGFYFQENSEHKKAITYFERALTSKPDFYQAHSNLLISMTYSHELDADIVYKEHCNWRRQHSLAHAEQAAPFTNIKDHKRKLRVGYVSPDFRIHSVAYFLEPVFSEIDHDNFEIIAYSNTGKPDEMTERLKNLVDAWHDTTGLTDKQMVELIREDKVDILVDLAGHTAGNRLRIFTLKPAPIQISYLGYPNTTGVTTIDYRLTDAYADSPGLTERYFTEELVRLPGCFLCYKPPGDCPDSGGLPANVNRFITFGCFNNPAKLNVKIISIWSEILRNLPDSRILLKGRHYQDKKVQDYYANIFKQYGVRSEQIIFNGLLPSFTEHMNLYNKVDIALDTFPYNGTTTTCEALWMGVPVVTLTGHVHQSRVGKSILSNISFSQFVADTPVRFIDIASTLASDPETLSEIRKMLRDKMFNSTLTDAKQFSKNMEKIYRDMWIKWCSNE